MAKYKNAKELSSLSLGKATDYIADYTPALLQPVPRKLNRDDINIDEEQLPFYGEDLWLGYELSWLNNKGKPQVAVAEFRIPCTSPNIIESKSFKLYLNSFNQTKINAWDDVTRMLTEDLSHTAGAKVSVTLYSVNACPEFEIFQPEAICIDDADITVTEYDYNQTLLENCTIADTQCSERLVSHLLKSNCLITNQPDWASIYIDYVGPQIKKEALLEYLISFRQHNEFHEQCVERIFVDLMNLAKCEQLSVYARYTRRGGLDINPFRSTQNTAAPRQRSVRQ